MHENLISGSDLGMGRRGGGGGFVSGGGGAVGQGHRLSDSKIHDR